MRVGMPVAVCEFVGGAAARRRAQHRDVDAAVGVGERAQRQGLAGAGDAGDADDPVRPAGSLVDEHPLLARSSGPLPISAAASGRRSSGGTATSRPASASSSASRSTASSSRVVNRAGRPGRSPASTSSTPGKRDSSPASSTSSLTLSPAGSEPAIARTSSGIVNVVCFSVRPSRPSRRRSKLVELEPVANDRALGARALRAPAAEAMLGRARQPLLAQPGQVDLLLRLTGRERGDPRRGEPLSSERLHVLDQQAPPSREGPDRRLGYPGELAHPLRRLGPLQPKPPSQFVPKVRLVQVAGREPVGAQDRFAVERPPLAVGGTRHVGHDHMRVQMRVLRPARAVPERRRDEPLTMLAAGAAMAAPDDAGLALEVAERRLPRGLMRLADLAANPLVVGERVQQADALRAREHEVVPRNRCQPLRLLPPLPALEVERPDGDRPLAHRRPQLVPVAGSTPRRSVPSPPSSTTPTSPSSEAPLPAHIPGDSPRPA